MKPKNASPINGSTVAVLHYGDPAIRGSEACLRDTIDGLHERGSSVVLLANHPEVIVPMLEVAPAQVIHTDFHPVWVEQRSWAAPFRFLLSLSTIWRKLRSMSVSIILASGGLPCQIGLPLARLLGVPIICHFHHPATRRYFYGWLVKWVDAIFCPSEVTAASVKAACGRDSTVIPNGVDVEGDYRLVPRDPAWRERLGVGPDTFAALQVGALTENKRPDALVKAIAILRQRGFGVCAVFVGEGPLKVDLKRLSVELGVADYVTLLGRVPVVPPYFQHVADVHVLPSSVEGFGISVIEAAACGLPNLVSVPSAMQEIIRNGVDGLHVNGADPYSIADALESLIQNPAMRRRMGETAAERMRQLFSMDAYKERVVSIVSAAHRDITANKSSLRSWWPLRRKHDRSLKQVEEVPPSPNDRATEPPTLLCVSNFPSDVGFAWDYIAKLWAGIADKVAIDGIRTVIAYPSMPVPPRSMQYSHAKPVVSRCHLG